MAERQNQEALDRAVKYFGETKPDHQKFCSNFERRYDAYRGLASGEHEEFHPPHVNRIVETTLASLIDDGLQFTVKSRSLLLDPEAKARAALGAQAMQSLTDWQVQESHLPDEQRPFNLQHAIGGLTVAKTWWITRSERRRTLKRVDEPVISPLTGEPLIGMNGQPVTIPRYVEETKPTIVYDGPVTETVDIRDFGWHTAATKLSNARYVWHRVWDDRESIEEAIDKGVYGPAKGGWTKKEILEAIPEGRGYNDDLARRSDSLINQDRTKDKVAVVELWDNVRKEKTVFVGDKGALLAHGKFPFWHDQPPFVVCSAQPDLFRIPGMSQVEKVEQLQKMLWKLSTQRLLNLELINNAIFMFGPDHDPDDSPFGPGEQWIIEDPASFNQWAPNVIPAEVSLGAEALLKGDMQDLAGNFPFTSGSTSQTVDNKTATGASLVAGLAQRSIDLAKGEVYKAWRKIAAQRGSLNRQFVRAPTLVPVTGPDGKDSDPLVILPELLQGDLLWEVEPEPGQMRKQEEQASAQALLQIATSIVGPLSIMAQNGMGRMVRLDLLFLNLLKAAQVPDPEQYFASAPPPPMGPDGEAPGTAGVPATPPQGPPSGPGVGVTAPQAADASSPSNAMSLSPMVAQQRAAAMGGPTQ